MAAMMGWLYKILCILGGWAVNALFSEKTAATESASPHQASRYLLASKLADRSAAYSSAAFYALTNSSNSSCGQTKSQG